MHLACLADADYVCSVKTNSCKSDPTKLGYVVRERIIWALASAGGRLDAENNAQLTPLDLLVQTPKSKIMAEALTKAPKKMKCTDEWHMAWEQWRKGTWCLELVIDDAESPTASRLSLIEQGASFGVAR